GAAPPAPGDRSPSTLIRSASTLRAGTRHSRGWEDDDMVDRGGMARTEAVVDLAAVRQNVRVLAAAAPGAAVMAVVKADGYGHGAVPVARAALDAGATWLGVCTLDEALARGPGAITAPFRPWLHLPTRTSRPPWPRGSTCPSRLAPTWS